MNKYQTPTEALSVKQRDDIVRLLHQNEVKTLQEALELITDRWDIKGHQKYALDLHRLGKWSQLEPLSILPEVQAAIGSETYDELENEIESYIDWIDAAMGNVPTDEKQHQSENYFQEKSFFKSDKSFLIWVSLIERLRPFALEGDISGWLSRYREELDQLTTEDLVFGGEYWFHLAPLQFDDYAIRAGESGYSWSEHTDAIWTNASICITTFNQISEIFRTSTELYFREYCFDAIERRKPLVKDDIEFLEKNRTWVKQQLEQGCAPFRIVRGLRANIEAENKIVRFDSQLASVLVDELGLETQVEEIFSNTSGIGFDSQTPEID